MLRKDAEKDFNTRSSKNPYDGSRPCAIVLPLLLKGALDNQIRRRVEQCIAVAVTHASGEVRDYAAEGIRSWLWEIDPTFAKACVGGLCELANVENQIRQTKRRRKEYSREGEEGAILAATREIRGRIIKRETFTVLISPEVDLETHGWPELLDALNMIKPDVCDKDLCTFIMGCLTAALRDAEVAEAWKSNHRHRAHYDPSLPL